MIVRPKEMNVVSSRYYTQYNPKKRHLTLQQHVAVGVMTVSFQQRKEMKLLHVLLFCAAVCCGTTIDLLELCNDRTKKRPARLYNCEITNVLLASDSTVCLLSVFFITLLFFF